VGQEEDNEAAEAVEAAQAAAAAEDEEEDESTTNTEMPMTMAASVMLEHLPRDAHRALSEAGGVGVDRSESDSLFIFLFPVFIFISFPVSRFHFHRFARLYIPRDPNTPKVRRNEKDGTRCKRSDGTNERGVKSRENRTH